LHAEELTGFDHLKEGVTVLRSELDGEVKILHCEVKVHELVLRMTAHGKASTLAPDFA